MSDVFRLQYTVYPCHFCSCFLNDSEGYTSQCSDSDLLSTPLRYQFRQSQFIRHRRNVRVYCKQYERQQVVIIGLQLGGHCVATYDGKKQNVAFSTPRSWSRNTNFSNICKFKGNHRRTKGVLCLFICTDVKVKFVVAGDPEDTSDDMPLLFSPAGAASPGTGHASSDLELQEHCHGLEPVRDSGKVARRQLALATLLCTVFVTGEVVGGWVSGSLAIMSDAAHMFSDLASFGVSLLVLYVSERKATKKMTFGYHRAEALGALATLCIIWYVTGILVYLAVRRIHDNDFEIHETAMVVVASCAVVFNILLGLILHGVCGLGHGHSHGGGHGHGHGAGGDTKHINIRAAAIHVLGDLLQSIGVLISSVLIKCFGPEFKIADPICTLVFAVIVVVTTFTVLRDTLAILLEGAPPGLKYDVVATDLASIGDVVSTHLSSLSALIIILFARQVSVHSLHIWSLTADIPVLSVHLTTKQDADHNIIRNEAIK